MLMNNDELTAVVEGLVRRTGTPVEAFDRFIGSLDASSSNNKTELIGPDDVITAADGEQQQQAGVDTEAQLDQVRWRHQAGGPTGRGYCCCFLWS